MKRNVSIKVAFCIAIFWVAFIYFLVVWFASQPGTRGAFSSIHNIYILSIDDAYRFFLSSDPFRSIDLWFWSFYLPGNIVVDGFLSWVFNHNQFFMRAAHILCYMTGIFFVYKTGVRLGISRGWLLLSLLVLLLMPLNALLAVSFYGESLLASLLAIVMYSTVVQKNRLLVFSASMMPFFRPEGAFYLGFVFLSKLLKKHYRLALWLIFPSVFYALSLLVYFDWDLSEYYDWRVVFLEINALIPNKLDYFMNAIEPFYWLNIVWWITGALGFFVYRMRPLRPLFYGGLLVLVYHAIAGALYARNEVRYLFPMFPLLALSQAALLSSVVERCRGKRKKLASCAGVVLMVFVLFEHFLQIDPVRNSSFDGKRWPISSKVEGASEFTVLNNDLLLISMNQVAEFTYAYTESDDSINRVIIQPFFIFNKLDGSRYRRGVAVDYATVSTQLTHQFIEGYFFTLIPEYPQYGLYRLYPSDEKIEQERSGYALYVDYVNSSPFTDSEVKPVFENYLYRVYKVQYTAHKIEH